MLNPKARSNYIFDLLPIRDFFVTERLNSSNQTVICNIIMLVSMSSPNSL